MNYGEIREPEKQLLAVQRQIVTYLLEHPDAKDTAEGIMQWWLPGTFAGLRLLDLQQALQQLVRKGWLNAPTLADGTTVFALERGMTSSVSAWLEG